MLYGTYKYRIHGSYYDKDTESQNNYWSASVPLALKLEPI